MTDPRNPRYEDYKKEFGKYPAKSLKSDVTEANYCKFLQLFYCGFIRKYARAHLVVLPDGASLSMESEGLH